MFLTYLKYSKTFRVNNLVSLLYLSQDWRLFSSLIERRCAFELCILMFLFCSLLMSLICSLHGKNSLGSYIIRLSSFARRCFDVRWSIMFAIEKFQVLLAWWIWWIFSNLLIALGRFSMNMKTMLKFLFDVIRKESIMMMYRYSSRQVFL